MKVALVTSRTGFRRALVFLVAGAACMVLGRAGSTPDLANGWNPEAAAAYLDGRIDVWFERASELKAGHETTTCISCHTVVPYLLARPVLRQTMHLEAPTPQEIKLLKQMALRIETYPDHQSLSDSKHGGERGTEAVLNALVLACSDAVGNQKQPSALTQKAFRQLWDTQTADGAWDWMDFGEEPDETADSRYNGAAMAAFAIGSAPGLAGHFEADTLNYLDKLRTYLRTQFAGQNLYRQTWMLLASTRMNGLLEPDQAMDLITKLRYQQNADGGWSLYKLGPWRWSRKAAPYAPPGNPDLSLLGQSDGYATGLVVFSLRKAGVPASDTALRKAIEWLKTNQQQISVENRSTAAWRCYSLNHDRQHGGPRGGEWKQFLMSDLATAFAVLALSSGP